MTLVDPLWLSGSLIDKMFVLYESYIHRINCEYDILHPNKVHHFGTKTFTDALFLQLMYLKGHLWYCPFGVHLDTKYYTETWCTLIELCTRGVFVIRGSCVPSCFEFVVVINDSVCQAFVEMLFVMSSLDDVSILARRIKHANVICNHLFGAEANNLSFAKLNMDIDIPIEHNVYRVIMKSNEHIVEHILLQYWFRFNGNYSKLNIPTI